MGFNSAFKGLSKNKWHGLKFKEEISKLLNLEHSLYDAEIWTIRKVDQKYLESSETVVLFKEGEDQLGRPYEKWIAIT